MKRKRTTHTFRGHMIVPTADGARWLIFAMGRPCRFASSLVAARKLINASLERRKA
jgi:hypothetical protein